jgi:hypothetical protein
MHRESPAGNPLLRSIAHAPPKKNCSFTALASRGGAKRTRALVALRAVAQEEGEAARAIVAERNVLACRGEGRSALEEMCVTDKNLGIKRRYFSWCCQGCPVFCALRREAFNDDNTP